MSNTAHYEYEKLLKAHVKGASQENLAKAICDFIDGAPVATVETLGLFLGIKKPE